MEHKKIDPGYLALRQGQMGEMKLSDGIQDPMPPREATEVIKAKHLRLLSELERIGYKLRVTREGLLIVPIAMSAGSCRRGEVD